MPRLFVYDGRTFPDPDSRLSVEDVRRQLADYFPELANADTREELRGEDTVYSFSRRIGTKGGGRRNAGRWTSWKFCVAFVLATFAYLSWPRSCCSRTAAWMSMRPGDVSPN